MGYYVSKHGLLIVAHRGQSPGHPGKLSEGLRYIYLYGIYITYFIL